MSGRATTGGGHRASRAMLWGGAAGIMVLFGAAGWWLASRPGDGATDHGPKAGHAGIGGQEAGIVPEAAVIPPPIVVQRADFNYVQDVSPSDPLVMMPDGAAFLAIVHKGPVDSLVLSDAMNGRVVETITGASEAEENQILTACLSPDGKMAVTGNASGWVRLWDVTAGKEIGMWKEERSVAALAFSTDGKWFATGGNSGNAPPSVEVYEVGRKEKLFSLVGHQREGIVGSITQVLFAADGKQLVSAGNDRTVRVWDLDARKEIRKLEGHSRAVTALGLSPDGKWLVSGGADGRVCLWEMASGKLVRRTRQPADDNAKNGIAKLLFSGDGRRLIIGGTNQTTIVDVETGQVLVAYPARGGNVLLMKDDLAIVLNRSVWSVPQGLEAVAGASVPADADPPRRALLEFGPPALAAVRDASPFFLNQVRAIVLVAGEREVLAGYGGWLKPTLARWNLESGELLEKVECQSPIYGQGGIEAISADGTLVAMSSSGGKLILAETATGKELRTMEAGSVSKAAFSPDGSYLIVARTPAPGDGNKADILVFGVEDGKLVRKLEGATDWVRALAMTRDGKRVIAGSGSHDLDPTAAGQGRLGAMLRCDVRVWDMETGKALGKLEGHDWPVDALAVAADGRRALTGAERGETMLWDLDRGTALARLRGHNLGRGSFATRAVAFSPDGKHAATGGADGDIRYYELEGGKEVCRFEEHTEAVTSLVFLRDGKRLISGSEDGTVRVWALPRE